MMKSLSVLLMVFLSACSTVKFGDKLTLIDQAKGKVLEKTSTQPTLSFVDVNEACAQLPGAKFTLINRATGETISSGVCK